MAVLDIPIDHCGILAGMEKTIELALMKNP